MVCGQTCGTKEKQFGIEINRNGSMRFTILPSNTKAIKFTSATFTFDSSVSVDGDDDDDDDDALIFFIFQRYTCLRLFLAFLYYSKSTGTHAKLNFVKMFLLFLLLLLPSSSTQTYSHFRLSIPSTSCVNF